MLVYYTDRIKSDDKSLAFEVDHLTDSMFVAVKICQGSNEGWNSVPLKNCKKIEEVLRVICPLRCTAA